MAMVFKFIKTNLCITLLLMLAGSVAAAAPSTEPSGLTALTATAFANNPGIAAAQKQADAALLKLSPATSLPDPELMIESMDNPLGSTMKPMTQGFAFSWIQMMPFPGKLDASAAKAQAEADLVRETYRMKVADLQKDIALMYYGIATMDARLAVEAKKQKQLEVLGAVIAAAYTNGKATLSEFIRTNNMRAMVTTERLNMEAERAKMTADLTAMLGQAIPKETVFTYQFASLGKLPAEQDVAEKVRANFPELLMQQAMERRMTAEANTMRLESLPDFTLQAKLNTMNNGDKTYSVGVAIPLPLFYQTKQGPLAGSADAMKAATSLERADVENRIVQTVQARYLALQKANEALLLYQNTIKSGTQQAFDVALKDYQISRIGFNELIETFQALYDTQSGLEQAKQRVMEERVYLDFYTANTLRWEEKS